LSGIDYERELREKLKKQGYLVIRSAGSHLFDLVALKPNEKPKIIEVKSTKNNKFYTSSCKDQIDMLNDLAYQGYDVYLYIRWIGKDKKNKWSKHKLPFKNHPIISNR